MSSVKQSGLYVLQDNGMQSNIFTVRETKTRNSTNEMYRRVTNVQLCMKRLDTEVAKHPADILKKRNDIGKCYYQARNVDILCSVLIKVIKLMKEEDMLRREEEEQQETQNKNKKQKTTHKVSIGFQFNMSEPAAAFNPGKVTIKSAGVKRTIYQQQNN